MDSKIGLVIQMIGVGLITILTVFLRRSLKMVALKYWATSWLCLSFALICLRLAFSYEHGVNSLFSLYFLGEYLFGITLVAGCLSLERNIDSRPWLQTWVWPLAFVAIVLPLFADDFNNIFNLHSTILACFFVAAVWALHKTGDRTFGWQVLHTSLILLAVDFLGYSALFTSRFFANFSTDFLAYNSIVDLVLETSLGFGMVIILLEKVLANYQVANDELQVTQKKLEELVQTDPLTAAFNRHAFYGFLGNRKNNKEAISGCVGFFDIDDLKEINDRYGHIAGDMAIRAVARAIREVIRAEDLMYRWGGDEFFVIMISMEAEMAKERMLRIDSLLMSVLIEDVPEPIKIGVSCGFNNFQDSSDLETAIKKADSEMYLRKQARKKKAERRFTYIPTGVVTEAHAE